ncbi:MAG: hypothetical protein V3V12_04970 [Gammaproteobacteria bacterium]
MKNLYGISLTMFIVCGQTHVNAENAAVGIKAGTLGLGVEISTPLPVADNLNGRFGFNYFQYDRDDTLDGVDYDSDTTLNSFSALLDWHPLGNGFRLSSGLFYNNNDSRIESTTTGRVDIGGVPFVLGPNAKLKGELSFDSLAPYLGVGYGHHFDASKNLSLTMELGILFQGEPEVDLNAEGALAQLPGIQAAIQKEEDDIQADADDFTYFPVFSIGLTYRY